MTGRNLTRAKALASRLGAMQLDHDGLRSPAALNAVDRAARISSLIEAFHTSDRGDFPVTVQEWRQARVFALMAAARKRQAAETPALPPVLRALVPVAPAPVPVAAPAPSRPAEPRLTPEQVAEVQRRAYLREQAAAVVPAPVSQTVTHSRPAASGGPVDWMTFHRGLT